MIELSYKVNSMQLWVGELLDPNRVAELNRLCSEEFILSLNHSRFILPQSILGERGFIPLETTEQQAFCQILAHAGCIPSCLLFGLSLSDAPPITPRVLCDINAYEYMYIGIEAILHQHNESGLVEEAEYFVGTKTMYQICQYVIEKSQTTRNEKLQDPVLEFAKICLASIKLGMRFDA